MILQLLGSYASWSKVTGNLDDDWIDRVSHLWTVVLLAIFAVAITSGQFMGNPIECFFPANFPISQVAYAKSACWVSNTYYIPMEDAIPVDIKTRQEAQITYYQWVPIILIFQAFLFKFPNMLWRMCNGYSGLNLDKICNSADKSMMKSQEDRMQEIMSLAKYLHRWVVTHRNYHFNCLVRLRHRISNVFLFCIGKREGTFLTGFYLFIKFLYCGNIVGQFFLLNAFMANNYHIFGLEVIRHLVDQTELVVSTRFPRVTLCDFQIRQLTNVQRWTVQCVLPVNMFNEKIFIFLWFWFFLVGILTFLNFLRWLYYVLFGTNRIRYIRKYLRINNEVLTSHDKKLSRKFADDYLREDGIFILRVIAKNTSEMVVVDLVGAMWNIFKEEHSSSKPEETHYDDADPEKEKQPLNGIIRRNSLESKCTRI